MDFSISFGMINKNAAKAKYKNSHNHKTPIHLTNLTVNGWLMEVFDWWCEHKNRPPKTNVFESKQIM